MPYETILTDLSDNIFTITINRPDKLNALNTTMIREFIDAIDTADRDDAARATRPAPARSIARRGKIVHRCPTGPMASRTSRTTMRATAAGA
jgi:hypothetical protein